MGEILVLLMALGPLALAVIVPIVKFSRKYRIKNADYYPKTDRTIVEFLSDFTYYLYLSKKSQQKFVKRVRYTGFYKKFIGKQGLEVTDKMRIEISASLVQLTFGYKDFEIPHFNKVWVYPDIFYHPVHRANMKGFTAPNGVVAVSWPDFQMGYDRPDDNYNLGLHELAHALHLNSQVTSENDNPYFQKHFDYWKANSVHEFEQLRNGTNDFLRKYGGSNFHEFFAVCVEHFFESPEAFYHELPMLYIRTCLLLSQNPLNINGDYSFIAEDFVEVARMKRLTS